MGVLLAVAGDEEGYRELVTGMIDRFGGASEIEAVEQTCKLGLLLPEAIDPVNLPAAALEQALESEETLNPGFAPWGLALKGLCHGRLSASEEADAALRSAGYCEPARPCQP